MGGGPDEAHGPSAPRWLEWTRSLQSIAQAGLTYARDPFDIERYEQLREVTAEIAAYGAEADPGLIRGFFASQQGYPTPKIDVRAAVVVEDRILLVKERDDGRWSMPGGWADIGESASEAAVRETSEEAGLTTEAVKLIAFYERERRGHPVHPEFSYKAFFACRPVGAVMTAAGAETEDARFFGRDEIPTLSLPRVTPAELDLAFAHHRCPDLPTEFD